MDTTQPPPAVRLPILVRYITSPAQILTQPDKLGTLPDLPPIGSRIIHDGHGRRVIDLVFLPTRPYVTVHLGDPVPFDPGAQ